MATMDIIKHYGGSYPDVLEYDKDGTIDVKTYEWMTGYDRNTGVTLNMPRYATYRMDSKGKKISMIFINDDQFIVIDHNIFFRIYLSIYYTNCKIINYYMNNKSN